MAIPRPDCRQNPTEPGRTRRSLTDCRCSEAPSTVGQMTGREDQNPLSTRRPGKRVVLAGGFRPHVLGRLSRNPPIAAGDDRKRLVRFRRLRQAKGLADISAKAEAKRIRPRIAPRYRGGEGNRIRRPILQLARCLRRTHRSRQGPGAQFLRRSNCGRRCSRRV